MLHPVHPEFAFHASHLERARFVWLLVPDPDHAGHCSAAGSPSHKVEEVDQSVDIIGKGVDDGQDYLNK